MQARLTALALALLCASSLCAQWKPLFDGKSLEGWKPAPFRNAGEPKVENAAIVLHPGAPMTGVNWTGPLPKSNYEVRFEAMRMQGNDFFASLTFPVGESFATWVTGGWGGDIVGLSSIDNWDASENETRSYVAFENGRWYTFRLQVTDNRIRAWIDEQTVFDVNIGGRTIGLRPGDIKLSAPFGFAAYNTKSAIRKVELRTLPAP